MKTKSLKHEIEEWKECLKNWENYNPEEIIDEEKYEMRSVDGKLKMEVTGEELKKIIPALMMLAKLYMTSMEEIT